MNLEYEVKHQMDRCTSFEVKKLQIISQYTTHFWVLIMVGVICTNGTFYISLFIPIIGLYIPNLHSSPPSTHTWVGSFMGSLSCHIGQLWAIASVICSYIGRQPNPQMLFGHIIQILWKYCCSHFYCNDLIRWQICTCHSSLAAVSCAKLSPHWIIILHANAKHIFTGFTLRAYKPLEINPKHQTMPTNETVSCTVNQEDTITSNQHKRFMGFLFHEICAPISSGYIHILWYMAQNKHNNEFDFMII